MHANYFMTLYACLNTSICIVVLWINSSVMVWLERSRESAEGLSCTTAHSLWVLVRKERQKMWQMKLFQMKIRNKVVFPAQTLMTDLDNVIAFSLLTFAWAFWPGSSSLSPYVILPVLKISICIWTLIILLINEPHSS